MKDSSGNCAYFKINGFITVHETTTEIKSATVWLVLLSNLFIETFMIFCKEIQIFARSTGYFLVRVWYENTFFTLNGK